MTTASFQRALLVEDEPNLAAALGIAFRKLGIPCERVGTLAEARKKASGADFILLDRNLPDGDGLDLCRELREAGSAVSVLMLTAASETDERVRGLNAGADDYLPKPFAWEELTARVHALARRAAVPPTPAAVTSWQRDEKRLRIRAPGGSWTELTPLEYKLATHLMSARGAIISREELLKEVWGFTLLPKTRTVDHFLGRLRKFFEQDPEAPKHFLTVRGAGYRFEG